MEESNYTFKDRLNYSAIMGLVLIGVHLIMYLLGASTSTWATVVTVFAFIGTQFVLLKKYRDTFLGGYISYGRSLGEAVLISLFASIVVSVYLYVFLSFIDAGFVDDLLDQSYEQLVESGMDDSMIDTQMELYETLFTPGILSIMNILSTVFYGFISGLIVSIFIKRDSPNPF